LFDDHYFFDLVVVFFGDLFLNEACDVIILLLIHNLVPVVFPDGEALELVFHSVHEKCFGVERQVISSNHSTLLEANNKPGLPINLETDVNRSFLDKEDFINLLNRFEQHGARLFASWLEVP
jgi:hypothetical protein